MKRVLPLALAIALTACGPSGNDPGPGGVSVDEAEALDDAAEMIEAQRLPPEALPDQLQADAPVELAPNSKSETAPAEDE